jgi:hypothetical protein
LHTLRDGRAPSDRRPVVIRSSSGRRPVVNAVSMPAGSAAQGAGFGPPNGWYPWPMLYTILIILAIIALLMFIFGRSRVR